MSRIMYRDADSVLDTLLRGVQFGKEIDRGLGFLDSEWFVDQHCLVRGRFARTLVAMHDQGFKFGIGVDENSGVIVRNGKDVEVIGYKGALVMDLSKAEHNPKLGRFNLKNGKNIPSSTSVRTTSTAAPIFRSWRSLSTIEVSTDGPSASVT